MKRLFIEKRLSKVTYVLEMTIAVLIAIGIVIGLVDLVKFFDDLLFATTTDSYQIFESFLAYALLLIVGIELILMVLYHSTEAILELILFVIARKMLIYSHTMMDLVLGTLAIAIVFAILKYLVQDEKKDIVKRNYFSYSGKATINEILLNTGLHIPSDDNPTVREYIIDLAEKEGVDIEEGSEFTAGDATLTVTRTSKSGIIEEVTLSQTDENGQTQTQKIQANDHENHDELT